MTASPLEIARAGPHEIAALAAVVGGAVAILIVPGLNSRALAAAYPEFGMRLLLAGLAIGGVTALLGITRTGWASRRCADIVYALQLERAGLVMVAPLMLGYAAATTAVSGAAGVFPIALAAALGAANVARVLRISRDLSRVERALADPHPAYPPLLADPGPPR